MRRRLSLQRRAVNQFSCFVNVELRHPALFLFAAFLALALSLRDASGHQSAEWRTDFRRHTVPLSEIVSGGPPKDGIPALSRPRLESVASADRWLAPREPVMVVEHDGVARGYPLQILIWHEIVNDNLGNLPIAVTFCPVQYGAGVRPPPQGTSPRLWYNRAAPPFRSRDV